MTLNWRKCTGNNNSVWCSFTALDLTSDHFNDLLGVYIIWSEKTVVRLGSGIIKDRIADHRTTPEITAYPNLKVTWAMVSENQMQGVEKYLADTLNPVVGERFPDVVGIEVNLPW